MLDAAGLDLLVLRELMGHSSPETASQRLRGQMHIPGRH
jgi:hypothetical protein